LLKDVMSCNSKWGKYCKFYYQSRNEISLQC